MDSDVAERLLPLEGGVNFRDMGGYETMDGRRIKWRHLFRSGLLSRLTEADEAWLESLGIRCVIDFRTATEQENEPNLWAQRAGIAYWSRPHEEHFGNLHHMVANGIATAEDAHEIMLGGFRHLPIQQGVAYAEMFRRLAVGDAPMVFNCAAGKDRTGGAAALVLMALGVPRETILADFAMTARAVDLRRIMRKPGRKQSGPRYDLLPDEVRGAIAGSPPFYIAALLDEIDMRFDGIEGYLSELGITAADHAAIREAVLE